MQKACARCNGALSGRWYQSDGRMYHPACFQCDKCHQTLKEMEVFIPDGRNTYCEPCHISIKSSPSKQMSKNGRNSAIQNRNNINNRTMLQSRSRSFTNASCSKYPQKHQQYNPSKNPLVRHSSASAVSKYTNTKKHHSSIGTHNHRLSHSQSVRGLSTRCSSILSNGFISTQNIQNTEQNILKWYIDQKTLNNYKQNIIGTKLYSNVYKSMWSIMLRPNGKKDSPQTAGKCIICLKLRSLPHNVSSLLVKWSVSVYELNRNRSSTNQFNSNQQVWACDIATFNEFQKLESMSIAINVEILTEYDHHGMGMKHQNNNNQMKPRINSSAIRTTYTEDIVHQLVQLGIGTREECIIASKLVINHKDINAVQEKVQQLQNETYLGKINHGFTKHSKNQQSRSRAASSTYHGLQKFKSNHKHHSQTPPVYIQQSSLFSCQQQVRSRSLSTKHGASQLFQAKPLMNGLIKLVSIVEKRVNYMKLQEEIVNLMINASDNADLLRNLQTKALRKQRQILDGIGDVNAMNKFLNDIILIENLLNREYTSQIKMDIKSARFALKAKITGYENKKKPICNVSSFIDLMFKAQSNLDRFKRWLMSLENQCKQNKINVYSSGATLNPMDAAFYKSFYIYSENGHNEIRDVLRCSLVFNNFNDIYRCFSIIEALSKPYGGILRCKDRFAPDRVAFGYRDLLINIQCPKSAIICEIQLHHALFYKHKPMSHRIYEKARLFQANGKNLAYKYANDHIRSAVDGAVYQPN